MSTSIRILRSKADKVLAALGDDLEMGEALGLVPYWGRDSARAAHSSTPQRVLREPLFVERPEDEFTVEDIERGRHRVD